MPSLRKQVEAVLFVAGEPVSEKQLCDATHAEPAQVREALRQISQSFEGGFVVRQVAGGWLFTSDPACREAVERFLLPPKTHISPAALETLAIVAYLQPVTRAEIESLRGVNVDAVLNTLEQRDFVQEVGRKEVLGRPILYATTGFFLEAFGLASIEELPPPPEGAPRRTEGNIVALAAGA